MRVLDLFSGIGGASLGLHWAGMRTVAFCEQDLFAARLLRRHWPDVPVYPDVRVLTARKLREDDIPYADPLIGPYADLLIGGFPCQDTSLAGRGAGLAGARSGLWAHMERLVAECRPRWVVAENVPGLEALGYACWPLVVGAGPAGAPHVRQRIWLVGQAVAADATGAGLEMGKCCATEPAPSLPAERRGRWPAEPGVRRVDDGVPARLDRLRTPQIKALGNAIVPANAAMIGRAILAATAGVR